MKPFILLMIAAIAVSSAKAAEPDTARSLYNWMQNLEGDWKLAPAALQKGEATQHKLVTPLLGTDSTAISFRQIGKGSTVQENLLPGTAKEMVSMYHCSDAVCSQVKATHYCVKQNQPEMLVDLSSSNNLLVYGCNMNTALCQSGQDHVHKISHELIDDGQYLKTTYTSFVDRRHSKDSVYVFTRK